MEKELRHHKNGRLIGNKPLCTDDFGELVFRCQYTDALVTASKSIYLGAAIPQVTCTYVCAPDATEAFKESKRAFDEMDANCNACVHFIRLPFERARAYGKVKGQCGKNLIPDRMVYGIEDPVFWVHPDDHMGLECWEQRPKKVKYV